MPDEQHDDHVNRRMWHSPSLMNQFLGEGRDPHAYRRLWECEWPTDTEERDTDEQS